jgi:hypothetical protein
LERRNRNGGTRRAARRRVPQQCHCRQCRWPDRGGLVADGLHPGFCVDRFRRNDRPESATVRRHLQTSEAYCISPDGTVIGGMAHPGGAALWINRGTPQRVEDLLLAEGIDVVAQGWTALFRIRSVEKRNGRLALLGEGSLGGPWWINGTLTPFVAEIADPTAPADTLRLTLRTTGSEVVVRVEPGGSGTLTLERSVKGNSWTAFQNRVLSSPDAFELNLGPATSEPTLLRALRTP